MTHVDYAIRCQGLWKSYDSTTVVRDLDLSVRSGKITALLGPSGCGKTTILRLIAGLEIADRGTIEIGGRIVARDRMFVPPERRQIGMVFQDYALFPHLSVAENIAYGLPARNSDHSARVSELLALVGLSGMEVRMPHEMSGGQQQRVALARALARKPLVVLLDEPFSNLDADMRAQLREEMREILRHTPTTAVFVTHDQEEALFMGDEVAVMNAGRIEQVDAPEHIFQMPRTRFIASFLGRADFVPATVTPDGLLTEVGLIPLVAPLPPGSAVDVLVRADDVAIAPAAGPGVVVARHFKGTHLLYRVQLPSGVVIHSVEDHNAPMQPGMRVAVTIDPGHPLVCFPNGEAVVAAPADCPVAVAPEVAVRES
jgi:iron(III) transport system ATP-binding protein